MTATMTKNEMIHKFMGQEDIEIMSLKDSFLIDLSHYQTDWNYLMSVVEKLDLIDGYTCISIDHDCVFLHRKGGEMMDFKNKDHGGKIGAVYAAVCYGVEWVTRG